MISEIEFFHDIFDEFVCLEETLQDNEIWKSSSIIKLMNVSHEFEDKQMLAEGLKMILNLCKFRECGELIDFYDSESYHVNDLTGPDKGLVDSILKAEFT
ncbi:MAG: hypothetical protein KGD58_11500 [Candidatus Lokiarchaeota archaeon]|nr:hypothetical protein [Candidatus Lokiarchaeota archaeon]